MAYEITSDTTLYNLENQNYRFEGDFSFTLQNKSLRHNVDIYAEDYDTYVELSSFGATDDSTNYDFDYYGGDGENALNYSGSTSNVSVRLSERDGFDFRFIGGEKRGEPLEIDVWTKDAEVFDLTSRGDSVDLRASTTPDHNSYFFSSHAEEKVFTWQLGGGDDTFYGSDYGEVVDGDSSDDIIEGGGGNDTIIGGTGDDTLKGDGGNDVIHIGEGADTVEGGAGTDTIYMFTDLNSNGVNTIYGDKEEMGAGEYNEKDYFFVSADTSETIISGSPDGSTGLEEQAFTDGVSGAGNLAGSLLKASKMTGWSIATELGFNIASGLLGAMLNKGANAEAETQEDDVFGNQIFIKDFDPWQDSVIVATGEFASSVTGDPVFDGAGDGILKFEVGDTPFLQLSLGDNYDHLSVFENEDAAILTDLGTATWQQSILTNVLKNSLKASKTTEVVDGEEVVTYSLETYSGVAFNQPGFNDDGDSDSAAEGAFDGSLAALFAGEEDNDSVWVLGDYGGSLLFGHKDAALAGTNSDNVMYSGNYSMGSPSTWHSEGAILMIGGAGDDIIFGSQAGGDRLIGGVDDDYLHGLKVGDDSLRDKLYGGAGTDTASFGTLYDEAGNVIFNDAGNGVFATLDYSNGSIDGTAYTINEDHRRAFLTDLVQGSGFDELDTSADNFVANTSYLYDIENLAGSDFDDILVGDSGANTLTGNDGNDYLIGGAGADTLEGGSGIDSYVFGADDGQNGITEFEFGESMIFLGADDTSDVGIYEFGTGAVLIYENTVVLAAIEGSVEDLKASVVVNAETGESSVVVTYNNYAIRADDEYRALADFQVGESLIFEGVEDASDILTMQFFQAFAIGYERAVVTIPGVGDIDNLNFSEVFDPITGESSVHVSYGELSSDEDDTSSDEADTSPAPTPREVDPGTDTDTDGGIINLTDTLVIEQAADQSSDWNDHFAFRAIDNDFNTENHTNKANSHWLSIDLGQDAKITEIDIYNRFISSEYGKMNFNNLLAGATVEILDDGKVIWSREGLTSDVLQNFTMEGIIGDELRISDESNYLHVSEIDIFGEFMEVVNLTDTLDTVTASQSSTWTSGNSIVHTADRAIDNDFHTENHTAKANSHWLSIDLGQDAKITDLDIYNRFIDSDHGSMRFNNLLSGGKVEILNNGETVWNHDGLTNDVLQDFSFDGVIGDEIRISDNSNYLHVSEVDVFGYAMETINLTDTLDVASGKVASQSSNWSDTSWVASWALDNDVTTNTHTANGDASPWFEVNLGKDAELEEISIVNTHASHRLNGASLVIYDEDEIVWSHELTGAANQTFEVLNSDGNNVVGDRVMIDHGDGQYVHIDEIDLYGFFV